MGGLVLVDAAKHCKLNSYSSQELFSQENAAGEGLFAEPLLHSSEKGKNIANSGEKSTGQWALEADVVY